MFHRDYELPLELARAVRTEACSGVILFAGWNAHASGWTDLQATPTPEFCRRVLK